MNYVEATETSLRKTGQIKLHGPQAFAGMRKAGALVARCLDELATIVRPGIFTSQIDDFVRKFAFDHKAYPATLMYRGYRYSTCTSINHVVCHGMPGDRPLKEGDIVSVDVGAYIGGFHGDCAGTYPCGKISDEAARLIAVTEQSFWEGLKFARFGYRVSDISHAVQMYVEENGFSVVRDYVGHGVGANLHESPEVPNYGKPGHGPRLAPGMTLAVEPMVNQGDWRVKVMKDGWTVRTADGSLAAHYENSILITKGEPEILAQVGDLRLLRFCEEPWYGPLPAMTEETSFWSSGRRATFSGWWTENAENLRLPKKNGESTLFPRGSGRTRLPAACKTASRCWTVTSGGRWPPSGIGSVR